MASDGGIFAFNARSVGSVGGKPLNAPIVGMAAVPGQQGYDFVRLRRGIFSFGAAGFEGSMGGKLARRPDCGYGVLNSNPPRYAGAVIQRLLSVR